MLTIVGIDEAGKGCVIGPLVIAAVKITRELEEQLADFNVRDSKLVKPAERELLYEKLIQLVDDYIIVNVTPQEIDAHDNLNWLEADHHVALIDQLDPSRAVIDCPSVNTRAYKEYVFSRLQNKKVHLLCEHKADVNHRVVSAASILAKVTRDRAIEAIKKEIGVDFGSGYLGDEVTVKFMKENWQKYPEIFRHSWQPMKDLKAAKTQMKLGEF